MMQYPYVLNPPSPLGMPTKSRSDIREEGTHRRLGGVVYRYPWVNPFKCPRIVFNAMTIDFREDCGVQMATLPKGVPGECEALLEAGTRPVFDHPELVGEKIHVYLKVNPYFSLPTTTLTDH